MLYIYIYFTNPVVLYIYIYFRNPVVLYIYIFTLEILLCFIYIFTLEILLCSIYIYIYTLQILLCYIYIYSTTGFVKLKMYNVSDFLHSSEPALGRIVGCFENKSRNFSFFRKGVEFLLKISIISALHLVLSTGIY